MKRWGYAHVRGWIEWIRERISAFLRAGRAWIRSPRRAAAVVVALALWMGSGGMTASVAPLLPEGEVFGEVHWYV